MTRPLWTAAELRAATGGACDDALRATGVSLDTRAVAPGELFIALRAGRDGHDFVAEAFRRGAGAMVDTDVPPGPVLRVRDTLEGLAALGRAGRARSRARVIGVTGSVGKTTTKEMLRRACAALGPAHASAASHNNHWGVPLTLARLPPAAHWAAVEMGMNHPGEIAPLARLARPHVAVVTAVGTAHVGNFGSEEAIADEKAAICAGLEPGGMAVLPAASRHFARLAGAAARHGARVIGFGEDPGAEARLEAFAPTPEGSVARLRLPGGTVELRLAQPGRHMALNALAALAAIGAAGGDAALAARALAGFGAGPGRGGQRRIPTPDGGAALLLDESYNASDAAVRAALAVLATTPARRRVLVLGDMLELGAHGPALHEALAPEAGAAAELVFCCGPLMGRLFAGIPPARQGEWAETSEALAPRVAAALRDGDAVLVKGSLGMRMATIIRALDGAHGKARE